jgi:hypothetical protein
MQTRIGHVHIRYRVPPGSSASATLNTLERVARERIADACDRAFENTFADDQTVYVLRKVTARVAVLAERTKLEARLAEQWGNRLSHAVIQTIVTGDHGNLVRFQNQAEFVTSFLTELVTGDVWNRWYFGAFQSYRELGDEDALVAVFEDNREWFREILRRLSQTNALDPVLERLGPQGRRRLWVDVVAGQSKRNDAAEAFLIFVESALRLIDALGKWAGERPAPSFVLDSYLRSRPAAPQWTDRASLADAVIGVIRFLAMDGAIARSGSLSADDILRLEETLAESFEWLDARHLLRAVSAIFQHSESAVITRDFVRRPTIATPEQKRLLNSLLRILKDKRPLLRTPAQNPHDALLRLLAALSEQGDVAPGPAAISILESIVESWRALAKSSDSALALAELRRGSWENACAEAQTDSADIARHLQTLAAAGEPAIAVVEELLDQSPSAATGIESIVIESACAGLFLLVRTLQDLRLTTLSKESEFESIEPLLVGLSMRIGGSAAWTNQMLDGGAALWSGIDSDLAGSYLAKLETLEQERFEAALVNLIDAQALIDAAEEPALDLAGPAYHCSPDCTAFLDRVAVRLLRTWARWLPALGNSSVPYLLNNFIRRAGTITINRHFIEVSLAPAPLDAIARLAGYLSETPATPWLANRPVRFRIDSQVAHGN